MDKPALRRGWWLLSLWLLPLSLLAQSLPAPTGFVNDYLNLLSPQQRNQLETYLRSVAAETSNEISIAILDLPEGETAENYTFALADQWKIGTRENENGVLVALYPNARKVRIEVGYGLEGAIPDLMAYNITQQEMAPYFQQNQYYEGLAAGVQALAQAARGEYQEANPRHQPQERRGGRQDSGGSGLTRLIPIILIILFILISRGGGRGGGGGYSRRGRYDGGFWLPFWLGSSFGSGWGSGNSGGGWGGGGGGGWGGGDFGGFGGGGFGGGGATGDW